MESFGKIISRQVFKVYNVFARARDRSETYVSNTRGVSKSSCWAEIPSGLRLDGEASTVH